MDYDFLVAGCGLYGAVFARKLTDNGMKVLCIDSRDHIGGNIYSFESNGIMIHKYGAHIFHTSEKEVWNYVNRYAEFNNFINSPVAVYKDELYNLPFNMNTFAKMWGIKTPAEALDKINKQRREMEGVTPSNLEEQAISLVGRDVYEKLIKGYTEKQWGRSCTELPPFIIKRLPVRLIYDNNYFTDRYQGIPVEGYTAMVEKILDGIDVKLNTEYKNFVPEFGKTVLGDTFKNLMYTGMIDEYYDYSLGKLSYRSLKFETEYLEDCDNYQGNAVVNYTEREIPYTRIIEHKHFAKDSTSKGTYITKEYPDTYETGKEPYYPINDEENNALYEKYRELSLKETNVYFGGRLGNYKYYDMDKIILTALNEAERFI